MSKNFYTQYNIGKSKYVVMFHNGTKTYKDGSPFYDIEILKNKRSLANFHKQLLAEGYQQR